MKSVLLRLYDGEICPAEQFGLKSLSPHHYTKNLLTLWTNNLIPSPLNFLGHSLMASAWAQE